MYSTTARFLLVLFLVACGGGPTPVGTWSTDVEASGPISDWEEITFYEDGAWVYSKFTTYGQDPTAYATTNTGVWEIEDGMIILRADVGCTQTLIGYDSFAMGDVLSIRGKSFYPTNDRTPVYKEACQ